MLVGVLERLHQTQRFVDVATDRQIVDRDLADVLFVVDDEQSAETENVSSNFYLRPRRRGGGGMRPRNNWQGPSLASYASPRL